MRNFPGDFYKSGWFIILTVLLLTNIFTGCTVKNMSITYLGDPVDEMAVVDDLRRTLSNNHPKVAQALFNLGEMTLHKGEYKKAEKYFMQALYLQERILPQTHHDIYNSLLSLADLYFETGRYTEAETYYNRILRTRSKQLGDRHPELINTLESLAYIYRLTERYLEAEQTYLKIYSILKESKGENDMDVANSLIEIATFFESTGSYNKSAQYFRMAIPVMKQFRDRAHPEMIELMTSYQEVLRKEAFRQSLRNTGKAGGSN